MGRGLFYKKIFRIQCLMQITDKNYKSRLNYWQIIFTKMGTNDHIWFHIKAHGFYGSDQLIS